MDVIYTVYNEFPHSQLEDSEPYPGDYISKRLRTKLQFKKHYDKLVENKLTYAEFCEAEFIVDETPCKNYEELNHHKLSIQVRLGWHRRTTLMHSDHAYLQDDDPYILQDPLILQLNV